MGDCSVVDEDVDSSDLLFNLSNHALHVGRNRYIRLKRDCLPSYSSDFAANCIRGVGSLTVVHGDISTSPSQRDGDGGSDPATASSHKRNSISEFFHGFMLGFVLCPVNPSGPHNPHPLLLP